METDAICKMSVELPFFLRLFSILLLNGARATTVVWNGNGHFLMTPTVYINMGMAGCTFVAQYIYTRVCLIHFHYCAEGFHFSAFIVNLINIHV